MKSVYLFTLVLFLALTSCQQNNADFIIRNASIYTVNSNFDTASVLVIKGRKILAVGNDSLLRTYHAVNVLNAHGAFIYPGFIDAHCHFTGYAMDKYKLVLYGCKSFDEVVGKVVDYARHSKREWIEGRAWDQHQWARPEFPVKDTLDRLFPDRPVFLMRIDGHAILCNQKALTLAGITEQTKVEGGEIVLKDGKLTGLLIDNAVDLVKQKIPQRTKEEVQQDFLLAQNDCTALGLTSLVDCGLSNEVIHWLLETVNNPKFRIGIAAMLADEEKNYAEYLSHEPLKKNNVKIIGFKVFADGSLGSRGAYLTEAYSDRPHHHGQLLKPIDSIRKVVEQVYASRYQLSIHAIGDATNKTILNLYAEYLKGKNDRRWRIEHAQVVASKDVPLFGQYQIIPSVQPTHATSDMAWAVDRLGAERIKQAYAYKTLLGQNGWLPLGTDFPVESLNPLHTFAAAVFRSNSQGKPQNGFQVENALSREEALKGITIWAARSTFDEGAKGSLEPGKRADFVILPTDLMKATADSIYRTHVISTYIGGEKVYPLR